MKLNEFELTKTISSFLFGDGFLRMRSGVKNATYGCAQIAQHEEYLMWQKSVLENLTTVAVYRNAEHTDKNGVNHQESIRIETKSHPFFTKLYDRWYFQGRKTFSVHDANNLDWRGLANWYMDDGYILNCQDKSQRGTMWLCTDNFTHPEVILLQKILYERFGLPFNTRKRGNTYRLVLRRKFTQQFADGVKPYVFESFKYKFRTIDSDLLSDDDIV